HRVPPGDRPGGAGRQGRHRAPALRLADLRQPAARHPVHHGQPAGRPRLAGAHAGLSRRGGRGVDRLDRLRLDRQAARREHSRGTVPHGFGSRRLDRLQRRRSLRSSTMNATTPAPAKERAIKEQVVLVLQGGGALGAYQAGVYQALMEGGIEPDWVIGTSIGAINGAIIAGNEPANRIARLREFWDGVTRKTPLDQLWPPSIFGNALTNLSTVMSGIPGFFT